MELTVKEYAQIERVDVGTVRRWIAKGVVAIRRTPGGHIRIRTDRDGSPIVLRIEDDVSNVGKSRRS